MAESVFTTALKRGQHRRQPLPGMAVLEEFCKAVGKFVGTTINCSVLPTSTVVNHGQEFKVFVTYHPTSYTTVLVRAYLKDGEQPFLDTYDGQGPQPCGDEQGLRQRLVEFLELQSVQDTLDAFRVPA